MSFMDKHKLSPELVDFAVSDITSLTKTRRADFKKKYAYVTGEGMGTGLIAAALGRVTGSRQAYEEGLYGFDDTIKKLGKLKTYDEKLNFLETQFTDWKDMIPTYEEKVAEQKAKVNAERVKMKSLIKSVIKKNPNYYQGLVAAALWWASYIPGFNMYSFPEVVTFSKPTTRDIYKNANLGNDEFFEKILKLVDEKKTYDDESSEGWDDDSEENDGKQKVIPNIPYKQARDFVDMFIFQVEQIAFYPRKLSSDYDSPYEVVRAVQWADINKIVPMMTFPWKTHMTIRETGQVFVNDKEVFTPTGVHVLKLCDVENLPFKTGAIRSSIIRILEIDEDDFPKLLIGRNGNIEKNCHYTIRDAVEGSDGRKKLYFYFEAKNVKGGEEFLQNASDETLLESLTDEEKFKSIHTPYYMFYQNKLPVLNKKKHTYDSVFFPELFTIQIGKNLYQRCTGEVKLYDIGEAFKTTTAILSTRFKSVGIHSEGMLYSSNEGLHFTDFEGFTFCSA